MSENISCRLKRKPSDEILEHLKNDFLPYYRYATIDQLCKLYNQSEKIVKKTVAQLKRMGAIITVSGEKITLVQINAPNIKVDYSRIRALWVLLRFQNIELHQPGSDRSGVLINFILNKKLYEIRYCSSGNYQVCNALMKISEDFYKNEEDIPHRIILIDSLPDISHIQGKKVFCFATSTITGEVRLFKKKDK